MMQFIMPLYVHENEKSIKIPAAAAAWQGKSGKLEPENAGRREGTDITADQPNARFGYNN